MTCCRACLIFVAVACAFCSNAWASLFKDEAVAGALRGWVSNPQQDFANVKGPGAGGGFWVAYFPNGRHLDGLRLDMGWTWYGWDTRHTPQGKIESMRRSFRLTMGPQFSASLGGIVAYVAPVGGLYYYWTTESLEGSEEGETRFHSTKWGWGAVGGLLIPLEGGPVSVDSGTRQSGKDITVIEIGIEYHTIHHMMPSQIEDIRRDANELAVVLGIGFIAGRR